MQITKHSTEAADFAFSQWPITYGGSVNVAVIWEGRKHIDMLKLFQNFRFITALLNALGCETESRSTSQQTAGHNSESPSDSSPSLRMTDHPARHVFHRNAAFTDVTKNLPDNSVDHIDFDMAANPIVVVLVTVAATHEDGLYFTTTFTGANDVRITRDWQPASGGVAKDKYVALFVLPDVINAGSTVVHKKSK